MTFDEYQRLAERTSRHGTGARRLVACALGVSGEAGEVSEHVKKHIFHGHPLNRAALLTEMGDVLWYLADLASALGVSLDDVAQGNIDKLRVRYESAEGL